MIYIALFLTVAWSLFGGFVDDKYAFDVFFISNQVAQLLVAAALFGKTSYKQHAKKMAVFVLVIINAWVVVNFFGIALFEKKEMAEAIVNAIFFAAFLGYCVAAYLGWWKRVLTTAKCSKEGSYIVFKKPKNKIGLLSALFSPPFGHRYLVVQGRCFYFDQGILVETDYYQEKSHAHLELKDIDIDLVRNRLVGTKFSLFKNCLTLFNRAVLERFYAK